MHERLRAHAESVAFFGGGAREKAVRDFIPTTCLINFIFMPDGFC